MVTVRLSIIANALMSPASIHANARMPGGDEHTIRLAIVAIAIPLIDPMASEILQRWAENRIFPRNRDHHARMATRHLPDLDPAFLPRGQGDLRTLRRVRRRRQTFWALVANQPRAPFSR
jgi:hypothetical protein